MSDLKFDEKDRYRSDEDRRIFRRFKSISMSELRVSEGADEDNQVEHILLKNPGSVSDFMNDVMSLGDRGYNALREAFLEAMSGFERHVRSHLLTLMARAVPDGGYEERYRESEVAQFGRFINLIIGDHPDVVCDWCEDMNADVPTLGLYRENTELIRGVMLAATIDVAKTGPFWQLAADAENFPRRMFSDPCHAREGLLFSSFHVRRYGSIFTVMSDEAVNVFVTHMRDHSMSVEVLVANDIDKRLVPELRDAANDVRTSAFREVAANVHVHERKKMIEAIFATIEA